MHGSVHWGVFSTLGEYHEYIGEEDIMNTWGDVQYIGGYHDVHVGDTMSTLRDVQYIRGYHEYIGVFNRN